MNSLLKKTSYEDTVHRWRVIDELWRELEDLHGTESFDVTAYGSHVDINIWHVTKDIERERELRTILPKYIFDNWPERKWNRTLMEYSGQFAYKTTGAREINGRAYEINLSLYGTDPQGCKITKVTRTIEVYESDCKDVEVSEDMDDVTDEVTA